MESGSFSRYEILLPLQDLTRESFLTLCLRTAHRLGWQVIRADEGGFVAHAGFSMGVPGQEVSLVLEDDSARLLSKSLDAGPQYWDHNRENAENFTATLNALKEVLGPEPIIGAAWTDIPASQEQQAPAVHPEQKQYPGFLAMFRPVKDYFITPVLIDMNLAVFIAMMLAGISIVEPGPQSLIAWGANYGPLTLSGQWWRVITNCFLHIGVIHLLMNMIALLFIGLLLEPQLGRARFGWAYLLTGVGGSVNSLWWHGYTISAGASGAIFGLYGVFLALLTTRFIERKFRKVQLAFMLFFVAYNLVNGVNGNIDNAAHIGGLCCGLLLGYAYLPGLKKRGGMGKYLAIALASGIILAASWLAYGNIPNSMSRYESGMKEFSARETRALTVYHMPPGAGEAQLQRQIKDTGIYYWRENARLVTDLDKLHLPPALHLRNEKLLRYCDLRIQCYELFFKSVSEHTDRYKVQMEEYNRQIEAVLLELK